MIKKKLLLDIKSYCELNNIDDVEGLINQMLQQGFTIEKYGEIPKTEIKETPKKEIKSNDYKINIKVEKEEIIEETIVVNPEIKQDNIETDIYRE